MSNSEKKYQFFRNIHTVKDIIYSNLLGDAFKIESFIASLKSIKTIEDLFSETETFIINDSSFTPVKIKDLELGNLSIQEDRFYVYLFPSDLVRALTNLAIAYADEELLKKYGSNELNLVKKWGQFNRESEKINEVAFINHLSDIQQLLNDVLHAYETNKGVFDQIFQKPKPDGDRPSLQENKNPSKNRSDNSQTPSQPIETPKENSDFFTVSHEDVKTEIVKKVFNKILKDLQEKITDHRFNPNNFWGKKATTLKSAELFKKINEDIDRYFNENKFLSKDYLSAAQKSNFINSSNLFVKNIFDTNWYNSYALDIYDEIVGQDSNYFINLEKNFIVPVLNNLDHKSSSGEKNHSAVVPKTKTKKVRTSREGSANKLTRDELKKIQYESAWLYNRAIYEMFTSYGIDRNDIDSSFLENLRSDIHSFVLNKSGRGLDQKDFVLLFGSASNRQRALLKFYAQFGADYASEIGFLYQKIIKDPIWENLNDKQRDNFITFHSNLISGQVNKIIAPTQLLREALKNIIGADSPVLNKNIQNTIDALIIQHKDENKLLKIINNLSSSQLTLVFGIPSSTKLSDSEIKRLKQILINYSTYRSSDLLLKTLGGLHHKKSSSEEENDIENLDLTVSLRKVIEKHGAETVANGIDNKKNTTRTKVNKVLKQYKTFVPLWENLSAEEQRIVYNKFNIAFDKNANKDTKLEFIPEFLFFDISTLKDFNNLKRGVEDQQNYQEFLEINQEYLAEMGEQLLREEKLGKYLRDAYFYFSQQEEMLLIADFLASQEGSLSQYPDSAYFDNYSIEEIMAADQYIQNNDYQLSDSGKKFSQHKGLGGKIRNSKGYKKFQKSNFYKKFNKKLNPTKKLTKSLEKAASSAAFKGIAAASNLILPGSGAFVYGLGSKLGSKNTIALIGGGLAFIVAKTLSALTSVGGAIGGLLGGGIGLIVGGPAGVVPGVILGANVGQAITPTKWTNSLLGGKPAPNSSVLATTAINNTPATEISVGSDIFFRASIPLLTVGLALLIAMLTSVYVISTIQSSFLIPLPKSFGVSSDDDYIIDGKTACFKFAPKGINKTIDFGGGKINNITSISWDQKSVDLFEAGLRKVVANKKYISLLCRNKTVMLYKAPPSPEGYGGAAISANEVILYENIFNNVISMRYTILHESGHIINMRNPGLKTNFTSSKTDLSCYTYPFKDFCNSSESFAEGLALYVIANNFRGVGYPFKEKYPTEYNWFKNNIFGGIEYY